VSEKGEEAERIAGKSGWDPRRLHGAWFVVRGSWFLFLMQEDAWAPEQEGASDRYICNLKHSGAVRLMRGMQFPFLDARNAAAPRALLPYRLTRRASDPISRRRRRWSLSGGV
jgi:hypothetical protein